MVAFSIVMVAIGLIAAVGFIVANRPKTPSSPQPPDQVVPEFLAQETPSQSDEVITYIPLEVSALLREALDSVPLADIEEAVMGCYGTMGSSGSVGLEKQDVRPFQTGAIDDLLSRTMTAVTEMESEQHISKFTISTQRKSKTNPHVTLLAHSVEPKGVRLIRFWRTQDGFVANLRN